MFDELTRQNIGQHVVRTIGRPKRFDAHIQVVEAGGHRAIFKDMSRANAFFRFVMGRWLIAREFAVYRALDGLEGVPSAYRMIDKDSFLIECIDGAPLKRGVQVPPEVYERCLALVAGMHERGVIHLDLRNRKNFLFTEDNRVYVIDFASALRLPRWLPFRTRWTALLGTIDRTGVLKMKRKLSPELLTEPEARSLTRLENIGAVLSPFHLIRRILRRRRRRIEKEKQTNKR